MIKEDYVSCEIAKLLRQKGFNESCFAQYDGHKEITFGLNKNDWSDSSRYNPSAPTLQVAMKWLREVHKVDITVDPHKVGNNWIYQFHICQNQNYLFSKDIDTSYENCAESAIKYCLENLI